MVYLYNGKVLSNKKKYTTDAYNMNELVKFCNVALTYNSGKNKNEYN